MSANQDGPKSFGGKVPSHISAAIDDLVRELDYQQRTGEVTKSQIQRQAVYEFLLEHWNELPEESHQNLEKEWLENKVDGGLGIDL